ncbi:hypothetical protein [Streptomyces griseoruber]|uniref:hypothetical protein n=1 Tax=Streptomyces griseoruber TaxID=1943 RepID=UPI000AC3EF89|nr:hypothetical protein [Streptomyces griseoruber]
MPAGHRPPATGLEPAPGAVTRAYRRLEAGALIRKARGHKQIAPDTTRVRRWIDGERPRPPVPALLADVLSQAVGQPLTPGDLGLTATGPTG